MTLSWVSSAYLATHEREEGRRGQNGMGFRRIRLLALLLTHTGQYKVHPTGLKYHLPLGGGGRGWVGYHRRVGDHRRVVVGSLVGQNFCVYYYRDSRFFSLWRNRNSIEPGAFAWKANILPLNHSSRLLCVVWEIVCLM